MTLMKDVNLQTLILDYWIECTQKRELFKCFNAKHDIIKNLQSGIRSEGLLYVSDYVGQF